MFSLGVFSACPSLAAKKSLTDNANHSISVPQHSNKLNQQGNDHQSLSNISEDNFASTQFLVAQHSLAQVNNVDLLRDLSPTDWAYEALVNLTSRYDCIHGFPDRTYRGKQAISRYDFAAGLNSCLSKLETAIATSDTISAQDIETLLRLMQDFQAELAIIRGRTDGLEARTTELELTRFSTTTKLSGEAIFGFGHIFQAEDNQRTVFGDRLRLDLGTSFHGSDWLLTRLSGGNFPALSSDSGFQGDLSFTSPEDNNLELEVLSYHFALNNDTDILIGVAGVGADDIVNTVNILDGDGGSGAISLFGTRNPIYLTQKMQV